MSDYMAKNIIEKNTINDKMDSLAKGILSVIDPTYRSEKSLGARNQAIQDIINREFNLAKGMSEGNIIDFIASLDTRANGTLIKNRARNGEIPLNYENIFTENLQDIAMYYQDMYKNRYTEMQDLKLVSKLVPIIEKALNILLSSICNSDDISDDIIRNIILPIGTSDEDKGLIIAAIELEEKNRHLKPKLRSVIRDVLRLGTFYIYATPYNKIFDEYNKLDEAGYFRELNHGFSTAQNTKILHKKSDPGFLIRNPAKESYLESNGVFGNYSTEFTISMDSLIKPFAEDSYWKSYESDIRTGIEHMGFNANIIRGGILTEALENAQISKSYQNMFNKDFNSKMFTTIDAVAPMPNPNGRPDVISTKPVENSKFNVSGLYIKYIDPKNVIPLKIFDQVVGYLYIRPRQNKIKAGYRTRPLDNSSIFANSKMAEDRKEAAVNTIADVISTGIIMNFSPEFVNANAEFKDLITECLISNGFANNAFDIQFISAEDMIRININEDINGNGKSAISDALFPAKLLTELIISKLLNYFNKGGNKQVAHIHKGPIDSNTDNQIQRTLRMLQQSTITFNDLAASSLVFSKFTRDSNMQMPTSRDGTRLVELEQIDGQQIDMETPMEEFLEKMIRSGCTVPDTFLDRIEDTSFSRKIISDHIELASQVSLMQSSLEEPLTKLYRKLVESSNLPQKLKTIGMNLKFKLPRPKALQNTNSAEFIQSETSYIDSIIEIIYGTHNENEELNKEKDEFKNIAVRDQMSYIDWAKFDEYIERAKIALVKKEKINDATDQSSNSNMNDSGDEW